MSPAAADSTTVRVVRVFTRDGAGGNLLGVHDGMLDDGPMQATATTLGFSETIFLAAPRPDGAVPVRIFTPGGELPFAGHPLVGATWHLTSGAGDEALLACGIGDVVGRRDDAARASIDVAFLPTVEPVRSSPHGVAAAWIARMPLPYEVHRLADPDAVARYRSSDRPDHRLVWAPGDGDDRTVRARFFAPALGVDEDPATGSAAVALAAVLRHEGTQAGTMTIHQGAEIGHPSRIDLSWTPTSTTIGGAVADDGMRTLTA